MADNTIQPVTDDAELAKVLDGMKNDQNGGLSFEETPGGEPSQQPDQPAEAVSTDPGSVTPPPADMPQPPTIEPPTVEPPMPPTDTVAPAAQPASVSPELDSIKKSALEELRPLVDKLDLPTNEKFDTYLLIIRSTDDQSLVPQAYEAARAIEDEAKRAEALLDIIKEIDYFANPQQPQA